MSIREQLAASISAFCGVPAHHLTDDTDLTDDIGLDEDESDNMLDAIEREQNVEITLSDRHRIITFSQLVDCIAEKRGIVTTIDATWGNR